MYEEGYVIYKDHRGDYQKWSSLGAGGLCSKVNLFFMSVSGTNKVWFLSTRGR